MKTLYFLLIVFFASTLKTISQVNNPTKPNHANNQIPALIDACISKSNSIRLSCMAKPKYHDPRTGGTYMLKIMPKEGTDSLVYSLIQDRIRYFIWPLSNVYGYYYSQGNHVFVMKSDVIKNTEIRRIQTSIDVITVMADSVLVIDTNLLFPADCYHVLYTFTFHKNLLKNKTGSVNYRVYYPVTQLPQMYWPVEFRDYLPYYRYIFEYERARVPWESCNCMECGPNYQFIRTPEEIEKMKHGTFEVNLRKWKNPIIE